MFQDICRRLGMQRLLTRKSILITIISMFLAIYFWAAVQLYYYYKYCKIFESYTSYCDTKKKYQQSRYVLSYSMFGSNSWKHYRNDIESIAKEALNISLYKDWIIRIYHDGGSPKDKDDVISVEQLKILEEQDILLKKYKSLYFCNVKKLILPFCYDTMLSYINGMTWRFIPLSDSTVDVTCSRDLDSALFQREADAVSEWLSTGKTLHLMRDRNVHWKRILGGMWCFKNKNNREIANSILQNILKKAQLRTAYKEADKGNDQDLLENIMWPLMKNDAIQHDAYLCRFYAKSKPFPSKRSDPKIFVGCGERPCQKKPLTCPVECRPVSHQDWEYC